MEHPTVFLERRPDGPRRPGLDVYRLTPTHEIVRCETTEEWAHAFEHENRVVAQCNVAGYFVSTVFLGIDHGWQKGRPVLFETMTFGPSGEDCDCIRWCTWDEAENGHRVIVARIKRERWTRPHAHAWRLLRRAYTSAVLHVSRLRWLLQHRRA